jgi:ABC-type nickel/cobalt efflux system permease component RcnA
VRAVVRFLLLAVGLLSCAGFGDAPVRAQPSAPSGVERIAGGGIGVALADFQRAANREIARHLQAIREGRGVGPLASGLVLAFLYGAVHAAGPGHGKLVVVGYFLSREARIGRGLAMGAQIALLHTASAVVVVALADFLLRRTFGAAPAEIPAVRIASYGLIGAIGLAMLVRAGRRVLTLLAGAPVRSPRAEHDAHPHPHGAACGCGAHARSGEGGLLALAVGLVPCTGSILVLLYALANDMLLAGLLLVSCIALGMAITMGALGLASVRARRFVLDRVPSTRPARLVSGLLEFAGAALVTAVGALLLAGSL